MKKLAALVLLGVMFGLLAAGIITLVTRLPAGEAIQLLPAPTTPPLVVHVSGAVVTPGVYTLLPGSRVADALQAAGGLAAQADPEKLNLAQVLTDGQKIDVPEIIVSNPAEPTMGETTRSIELTSGLININTANQEELESLPEIGPHLAQEIIIYRETNGAFESVDELLDVPGIGTVTLETIRDLITIE
jgi:competence protein ComEA